MIPIIQYSTEEGKALFQKLLSRSQLEYGEVPELVDHILSDIKKEGEKALFAYTEKFDHVTLTKETMQVTDAEIKRAYQLVEEELLRVIRLSARRIRSFHEKQKANSWLEPDPNGEMLGQMIRPLERVGVYVPGGKAAYPSSVLMNVIPAHVAGVKQIVMTTPVGKNGEVSPVTIVAAKEAGVDAIYKVGGAQAIGALAFGTESIPKVDKICGPGNIYVALAKRAVYGYVDIDSVAGPSEILILADETADPIFVAADMMSQAEHDELASAVLITTDKTLPDKVQRELERQKEKLSRKDIIEKSLANYGAIVIAETMEDACSLANQIAPEHLEIIAKEPFSILPQIQNAGAIFLGAYSPEPLGDYMAGPNHILPTGGTARFFSPLTVEDFVKKSSLISFSQEALANLQKEIITFANAEGLTAHANAVAVRSKK